MIVGSGELVGDDDGVGECDGLDGGSPEGLAVGVTELAVVGVWVEVNVAGGLLAVGDGSSLLHAA